MCVCVCVCVCVCACVSLCSIAARNGVFKSCVCVPLHSVYVETNTRARAHTHTHTHTHTHIYIYICIFLNFLSSRRTYSAKLRYYKCYVSAINCKFHHVAIITCRLNEHHHKSNNFPSMFQRLSLHSLHVTRHSEGICLTSLLHATERGIS